MAVRDRRWRVIVAVLAGIAVTGWALERLTLSGPVAPSGTPPRTEVAQALPAPAAPVPPARDAALDGHFQRGVVMLHARRFEYAAVAFHQVLRLAPGLPEAHVNMGYALLGQARPAAARDFFASALELNPGQANAYYGLAVAADAMGDRAIALGAMRTFVHLVPAGDPFVRKARAALWEWQSSAPVDAAAADTSTSAAAHATR